MLIVLYIQYVIYLVKVKNVYLWILNVQEPKIQIVTITT